MIQRTCTCSVSVIFIKYKFLLYFPYELLNFGRKVLAKGASIIVKDVHLMVSLLKGVPRACSL